MTSPDRASCVGARTAGRAATSAAGTATWSTITVLVSGPGDGTMSVVGGSVPRSAAGRRGGDVQRRRHRPSPACRRSRPRRGASSSAVSTRHVQRHRLRVVAGLRPAATALRARSLVVRQAVLLADRLGRGPRWSDAVSSATQRPEPCRHLRDRRRGDDEQPEDARAGEQQGRDVRSERGDERRAGDRSRASPRRRASRRRRRRGPGCRGRRGTARSWRARARPSR